MPFLEKYIEFFSDEHENEYRYNNDDEVHIASSLEPMPAKLLKFIQQKYNYENTYSNFAKRTYLANRCDHCNSLQGNNYLFNECDSSFFLDDEDMISLNRKKTEDEENMDKYKTIKWKDREVEFSAIERFSEEWI